MRVVSCIIFKISNHFLKIIHKIDVFVEISRGFMLFCIVITQTAPPASDGGRDNLHCRVLKLADKPSCLGGEDKRDKRKVMG